MRIRSTLGVGTIVLVRLPVDGHAVPKIQRGCVGQKSQPSDSALTRCMGAETRS